MSDIAISAFINLEPDDQTQAVALMIDRWNPMSKEPAIRNLALAIVQLHCLEEMVYHKLLKLFDDQDQLKLLKNTHYLLNVFPVVAVDIFENFLQSIPLDTQAFIEFFDEPIVQEDFITQIKMKLSGL